MNLDENQKAAVAAWIQEGLKLSEIQDRLNEQFRVRLTYMEMRFLLDDLKVTPKDPEPPKQPEQPSTLDKTAEPGKQSQIVDDKGSAASPTGKGVDLSVDQITKPGAVVSGKVTFSDGKTADWFLDQTGRLGLAPKDQGYRPPASDVQEFQAALDRELGRLGL